MAFLVDNRLQGGGEKSGSPSAVRTSEFQERFPLFQGEKDLDSEVVVVCFTFGFVFLSFQFPLDRVARHDKSYHILSIIPRAPDTGAYARSPSHCPLVNSETLSSPYNLWHLTYRQLRL